MQNRYFFFLILSVSIILFGCLSSAEKFGYGKTEEVPINYSLIPTVNSSDYWDDRDTPADITYDEISGGDVNAIGYTGYFNYIAGAVGQLSIDGNPWYLGGTSFEIDENLTVNGNSYLSNVYPRTSLTYSLGSGALRWLNLYVQNINAEEIDAFNLHLSENLTVDGFINGVNISNLDNDYLKLNQSTFQTITDGIPRLEETRVINESHQLVDKTYVDMAVADLGARYYALDNDSGIADGGGGNYLLTSIDPSPDAETYVESAGLASGNTFIRGWISPVGATPTKLIKGTYDFYVQAEKTVGTKTLQIYWELYEYKADTSEVLIATSAYSNEIASKADADPFLVLASDYTPDADSRIIGKIYAYVSGVGNAPTIRVYYRGTAQAHWLIPTNLEVLEDTFYTQTELNNGTWVKNDTLNTRLGDYYLSSNPNAYINSTNLTDLGYAQYQFTNNNFNGSGNFTTSGNVGIGTATPNAKLDVNGTIKSYNQTITNGTSELNIFMDSNGTLIWQF